MTCVCKGWLHRYSPHISPLSCFNYWLTGLAKWRFGTETCWFMSHIYCNNLWSFVLKPLSCVREGLLELCGQKCMFTSPSMRQTELCCFLYNCWALWREAEQRTSVLCALEVPWRFSSPGVVVSPQCVIISNNSLHMTLIAWERKRRGGGHWIQTKTCFLCWKEN